MTNPSPRCIGDDESERRSVKSGWYEIDSNGKIGAGPFPSRESCPEGTTQQAPIDG
jgi:hypothetical protein